jgi:hypothetical protein
MRPRLSVPLTALVLLVLIEAHRRLLASVILDSAAALAAPVRPLALLAALLPLLLLALPALPLPAGRDRRRMVAASAIIAALARLGAASPQSQGAGLAAALAMAAAAVYVGAGVGLLAPRTVAGGAALAFAMDVLSRWLLDPAAQAHRLVRLAVAPAETLIVIALALAVARSDIESAEGPERRAGGLRLRGALAFGAILFLETRALAAPAAAAARAALDRGRIAPALVAVAVGAAVWLLAGGGSARLYRPRLVLMGALAGGAAILLGPLRGAPAGVLLVAGHLCALLLLGRALAPASGRRGTWTAAGALAVLAALDGVLVLASAAPLDLAAPGLPWVSGLAAGLLVAALALFPRPASAPPLLPRPVAWVALAAGLALGLVLAVAAARPPRAGPPAPPPNRSSARVSAPLRRQIRGVARAPAAAPRCPPERKEVPATSPIAYNTLHCAGRG